ncbi:MAG TPA: hypothetical protein PKZ76_06220, partial [Xanthomonadaceae bacterium]|nr:hypothetical protein [Xanthomonadaceae bacterium]
LLVVVVAAPVLLLPVLAVVGLLAAVGGALFGLLLPFVIVFGVFALLWLILRLVVGIVGLVLWCVGAVLATVGVVLLSPLLLPILVLAGLFWLVLRALRPHPQAPALPAPN